MAGEEKTHTQGEVDILIAMERVVTLQCVMNDDFKDHKKEDEEHFDNLYEADKEILKEVREIPSKIFECKEGLKTEVLSVARKEFAPAVDLAVFKTEIKSSIRSGVVVSSVLTPVIISLIYIIYISLKG